jgi:hypothetical protein
LEILPQGPQFLNNIYD